MERKEEGITLIALVITIIIMLILAGIVLSLTLGEHGIIKTTQEAKETTTQTGIEEEVRLAYNAVQIDSLTNGWDINKKIEELEKELRKEDKESVVSILGEDLVINYKGQEIIIGENIKKEESQSIIEAIAKIRKGGQQEVIVNGKTSQGEEEKKTYSLNVIKYDGNIELDGERQIEGATLKQETKTYEFGSIEDVAKTDKELAQNAVVVKVEGNINIHEGVTLTVVESKNGYGGPKGFMLFCGGTLTNNGTISMSQKGAYAEAENVYLWHNAQKVGTNEEYEYVPKYGANGATSNKTTTTNYQYVNPNVTNAHGTGRQTAGGASGGAGKVGWNFNATGGTGGQGTSYSGGGGRRRNSNKCSSSNTKKWKLLDRRCRSCLTRE